MLSLLQCNLYQRTRLASKLVFRNAYQNVKQSTLAAKVGDLQEGKVVGYWLLGVCGLTATTVSLGGITRLTKSGLSMVDWHPFNEFPPKGPLEWNKEFEKYQQYPEFKIRNADITFQVFKRI